MLVRQSWHLRITYIHLHINLIEKVKEGIRQPYGKQLPSKFTPGKAKGSSRC